MFHFSKALTLEPANDEFKDLLARVNKSLNEQQNFRTMPRSVEQCEAERIKDYEKRTGQSGINLIKGTLDAYAKYDPGFLDVIKGIEYRDGSANEEINYEMAVKFFTRAMNNGYCDALYHLADLTLQGKGYSKIKFRVMNSGQNKFLA